jgi:hypothetical protein
VRVEFRAVRQLFLGNPGRLTTLKRISPPETRALHRKPAEVAIGAHLPVAVLARTLPGFDGWDDAQLKRASCIAVIFEV